MKPPPDPHSGAGRRTAIIHPSVRSRASRPTEAAAAAAWGNRLASVALATVDRAVGDQEDTMPRGDKSAYTDKQKRQAEHIARFAASRAAYDRARRLEWSRETAI
jgi:hypothetical protein